MKSRITIILIAVVGATVLLFQNAGILSGLFTNENVTWHRQGQLAGSIIEVKDSQIRGWAADLTDPTRPVTIQLMIDGVSVANIAADRSDASLTEAVCNGCARGFQVGVPGASIDGRSHSVHLYASTSGGRKLVQTKKVVFGSSSPLQLTTDAADDIIYGSSGADTILSMEGNDEIHGGAGDDTILGNLGTDIIYGDAGNDSLFGGKGQDLLIGGEGNDTLEGDLDNDMLQGGLGNDLYIYRPNGGHDIIWDEHGANTLDCSGMRGSLIQGSAGQYLNLPNGTITFKGNSRQYINIDSCLSGTLEPASGAVGVTTMGDASDNRIYGTGGNDTLFGGEGNDVLYGYFGDDKLFGGQHNDVLVGGPGDDTLEGDLGDDLIIGGPGNDRFNRRANGGNDIIFDEEGSNVIDCMGELGSRRGSGDNVVISLPSGTITLVGKTHQTMNLNLCVQRN